MIEENVALISHETIKLYDTKILWYLSKFMYKRNVICLMSERIYVIIFTRSSRSICVIESPGQSVRRGFANEINQVQVR